MAYGTVKVDNITFDNGGSDQNVTVSGLYRATTSGVTVSGTIAATTVSGVTVIGSTTVSGATVTGTTANFTSGNFSNIISSAATMSGALIMANQQQVRFREAVGNGVNHIALQAPAIVSADQTITLPDQTGTVVTTGDNGSVTSTMILDGTILNADINASAAIAGTKISPDFGSQTIVTTGVHSAAAGSAAAPSIAFTGDPNTGIYSPGADQLAVSTGGTGRLFVDASGNIGIGTSSPATALDVVGQINSTTGFASARFGINTNPLNTTSTAQSFARFRSTGGDFYIGTESSTAGGFFTGSTAYAACLYNSAATPLQFFTGGAVRATLNSTGLGIGTSSQILFVDKELNVNAASGSAGFSLATGGLARVYLTGNSTVGNITTKGSIPLLFGTDEQERLRIDSSGRVGIGLSPATQLDVQAGPTASSSFGLRVAAGTNTSDYCARFNNAAGTFLAGIDGSGNVGIGTTSPSATLELSGTGTVFKANTATTTSTAISLQLGGLVTSSNSGCFIKSHVNLGSTLNSQLSFEVNGGALEAVRIDSSGRLLVGTPTSRSNFFNVSGINHLLQVETSNYYAQSLVSNGGTVATGAAILTLARSRGTTAGSYTVVSSGDSLGRLSFQGADGTDFVGAAEIACQVDGTPGANDMPGRLVFSTTADGASTPTERMRITSLGVLKASTTGSYLSSASSVHEIRNDAANNNVLIVSSAASNGTQYGLSIRTDNDQNDATRDFLECQGGGVLRAQIRTNGGLANYSANNANLSDRNVKKDISPAADTWDCLKEWEIVNYRYKDQPDDADLNLGVIAQQVAESCPEVITVFQEAKEATETEPAKEERLGVKEQQMYWMAIKALQEAMERIETFEQRLSDAGIA